MDRSRLQAFVDGELSPEEAAELVLHLADHPKDQAYVDDLVAANVALATAFGGPIHEPVPELILTTIFPPSAQVLPFARRNRRGPWVLATYGGLAAFAAAVVLAVYLPGRGPDPTGLAVGEIAPGTLLHDLVRNAATGEVRVLATHVEAVILATMPAAPGFCREFELVNRQNKVVQLGLACGRGEAWEVDVVLAETLPETIAKEGFLPASGEDVAHMNTWLDRRNAGAALAPEEERLLLDRGWD